MTIIGIVIAILVIGFCWWLVDQIPIDPTFKKIAKGVLIFALVLWLLNAFGVLHGGPLNKPLT